MSGKIDCQAITDVIGPSAFGLKNLRLHNYHIKQKPRINIMKNRQLEEDFIVSLN
jgi:hypothetical protein